MSSIFTSTLPLPLRLASVLLTPFSLLSAPAIRLMTVAGKSTHNLQYVDSCVDFACAAPAPPTLSKKAPRRSRFHCDSESIGTQTRPHTFILHSPFIGLPLGPAIQPGPLIRRLEPCPRCSSGRTKTIPFQSMLRHLFARLRRSRASCLCHPLRAAVPPLLS